MSRVILVAGGNSISEGIELGLWDKIKDEENWSCNSAYAIMPYLPKKELFVDRAFFEHNIPQLQKLHEQGVEIISKEYHRLAELKDKITQYGTTREREHYYGKHAIEKNMIYLGRMGLAGQFALSVAVASNFDEIFLLGYDFGTISLKHKQTHVYQNQIVALNLICTGAGRPEVYLNKQNGKPRIELEDWNIYLAEKDIKIWNVSPLSNIPHYTKIDYQDFFERLEKK